MLARDDGWIAKAALAALCVYAGVIFLIQAGMLADTAYLHEELRLLFRYHQAGDAGLFAGDYLTSYVTAFPQPLLYDAISRLWVTAGGDLAVLHRLVPLLCWLGFLAGVALAARKLGDRLTVAAALVLAVAQPLYLYQITSAVPHAFAFPLVIWAFVALLQGSAVWLALLTILAGLLYPAMAPLIGLLLTWQIVVGDKLLFAPNAKRLKNVTLLSISGALAFWLLWGSLAGTSEFGAALAPLERHEFYPENGPGGRYTQGVFNPLTYVAAKAFDQFRNVFDDFKLFLLFAYCAVALYGLAMLLMDGAWRRPVTGFLLCSAVLIVVVLALRPYLLYRFILYPLMSITPLLIAVGLQQFFQRIAATRRAPAAAALLGVLLLALTLDSTDAKKIGYWTRLDAEGARVLAFAAEQPRDTLFATWPSGQSEFEFIPYFVRRPLFVMIKAHYPSHEDHVLEMRARTDALIDAYLATETGPLERLYCLWQVDYLIVDKAQFQSGAEAPAYFAPFDERIAANWEPHRVEDFLLGDPDPAAVALETEHYRVVRLQAIAEAAQGGAAANCRSS
jgi:hypothetical protein